MQEKGEIAGLNPVGVCIFAKLWQKNKIKIKAEPSILAYPQARMAYSWWTRRWVRLLLSFSFLFLSFSFYYTLIFSYQIYLFLVLTWFLNNIINFYLNFNNFFKIIILLINCSWKFNWNRFLILKFLNRFWTWFYNIYDFFNGQSHKI
jgi:hypothetical protein